MEKDKRIERIEDLVREKGVPFKIDPELWIEKKPKEEVKIDFFCFCGSREYSPHRDSNGVFGPGGRSWITHYECAGCSNIFHNLEKYAKAQRALEKKLQDIVSVAKIF